jgi:thioredoxin-related protein
MKRQHYIFFFIIIILMPLIIWLVYLIGTLYGGIRTNLSAGDLLLYVGSIFTSIATISAVVLTINHNKNEINKQNKRELQRTHNEKLYDEICLLARDIMVFLSLHELLSTLHPIIKSSSKPEKFNELFDKAREAIDNCRLSLMALHKKQWYYYERLKNDNFIHEESQDSQNVKAYFEFIYNLLNSLEEELSIDTSFQRFSEVTEFFIKIDKYRVDYQYDVTEKTTALIQGVRNIFVNNLNKYD